MSRPGRTALWQNLLRDNHKPFPIYKRQFPHIPRKRGEWGHTSVLPIRPVFHDARNLPAIDLLYLSPAPALASVVSACYLFLPSALAATCLPPAAFLPPACSCHNKKARPCGLAFLLSGRSSFGNPGLSEYQSRNPSRTSCSRILAQSATGRFSPSTNRSGHPRLQSSM